MAAQTLKSSQAWTTASITDSLTASWVMGAVLFWVSFFFAFTYQELTP